MKKKEASNKNKTSYLLKWNVPNRTGTKLCRTNAAGARITKGKYELTFVAIQETHSCFERFSIELICEKVALATDIQSVDSNERPEKKLI